MTTFLSPTRVVPTTPAETLADGVPCAARPGTPFRHLDGRCQCFLGGAAPELAAHPHPFPHPAKSSRTAAPDAPPLTAGRLPGRPGTAIRPRHPCRP